MARSEEEGGMKKKGKQNGEGGGDGAFIGKSTGEENDSITGTHQSIRRHVLIIKVYLPITSLTWKRLNELFLFQVLGYAILFHYTQSIYNINQNSRKRRYPRRPPTTNSVTSYPSSPILR